MCCKIPFVSTNFECDNNQTIQTDYLVNNKYYRNGVYFGDIIYSDLNKIQVECKNGNKYMDGQIITINFMKSNTILEFKIGRGGHFNNPGHLSYVGESKGISHTDAFNCLFQPLYKNGNDDFRKKSEWTKDNGTSSGLTNEMINSGIGKIVLDGDYDTTYTTLAKDCDENEARLIIEDQSKFDGKYTNYYLIQEVLGCNMLTAQLIIKFYEDDVLDYWFDTLSDDDFISRYFNEFNSEDEIEENIDYLSYKNKFYTIY